MKLLASMILSMAFLFIAKAISDFDPSIERSTALQPLIEEIFNQTNSYYNEPQDKFDYISSYIDADKESIDDVYADSPTRKFKPSL